MRLYANRWARNEDQIFLQLVKTSNWNNKEEMYRVFNCGVGMMIIINPNELKKVEEIFVREEV